MYVTLHVLTGSHPIAYAWCIRRIWWNNGFGSKNVSSTPWPPFVQNAVRISWEARTISLCCTYDVWCDVWSCFVMLCYVMLCMYCMYIVRNFFSIFFIFHVPYFIFYYSISFCHSLLYFSLHYSFVFSIILSYALMKSVAYK